MIVCDTGPLVALSNEKDEHYFAANNLFRDMFLTNDEIVLPATVLAEVCYWLNEHGGPDVEAAFLDSVADGTFTLVDLTTEDVERMAELVGSPVLIVPIGRHRCLDRGRCGAPRSARDRHLRPEALPLDHAEGRRLLQAAA